MKSLWPDYLNVLAELLGKGTPAKLRVCGDVNDLAHDLAEAIVQEINQAQQSRRNATLIVARYASRCRCR